VSVVHPEHRPGHPLAGAFVKALQSEAAALRLQLKSLKSLITHARGTTRGPSR
jgi:hypothetical protein